MNIPNTYEKNAIMASTLYLIATPIGNLSDISERAKKILSEVDFIAAEDTRNTQKMLNLLGIKNKTESYYEHNKSQKGPLIIERLLSGQSCALVSDAGTPAISDPGEDLVKLCIENSINVTSVPGCCAAITALILSGLPTDKFSFEGFLPYSKKEREMRLSYISTSQNTQILYESPHKLKNTLNDLYRYLGDRKIALCRELTKLNEDILRTTISDAIKVYEDKDPRGEYVLIIEGASVNNIDEYDDITIDDHVKKYIDSGMSKMDAIKQVAKDRNVKKSDIYNMICKE